MLVHLLLALTLFSGATQASERSASSALPLPKMIDIPAGGFLMGCEASAHCQKNEQAAAYVRVPSFKMSETEVTFGLWDACVAEGACHHSPDVDWMPNAAKGAREQLPVMLVSYDEIVDEFIPWLNQTTGKIYRLPTEVEWEYSARAGSKQPFSTGACLSAKQANINGQQPIAGCPESPYIQRLQPVASYAPNAFGLYDMHGNVWEWTESCWSMLSERGLPSNGDSVAPPVAGAKEDCALRVIRGGAWNTGASYARSAARDWYYSAFRYYSKGFRLAMTAPAAQ